MALPSTGASSAALVGPSLQPQSYRARWSQVKVTGFRLESVIVISRANGCRGRSECDITLVQSDDGPPKHDISCSRPPYWPFRRRKFNSAYSRRIRTSHLWHLPVFVTFILAYSGELISLWTGPKTAEGVLFLLVADLLRGFLGRDDMIQQVAAMASRRLRRKVGAIP